MFNSIRDRQIDVLFQMLNQCRVEHERLNRDFHTLLEYLGIGFNKPSEYKRALQKIKKEKHNGRN